MNKVALITGISGQDGFFLSEFLLEKNYNVYGITSSSKSSGNSHLNKKIQIFQSDLTDIASLTNIIKQLQPDEIYNLAAQSHVGLSFSLPVYTANIDSLGVLRILEAIRILALTKKTKLFQASSSELFGDAKEIPQTESTPFSPKSPYGIAKQYGYWIVKNFRESYNMFAVNGILFNHESEYRSATFVTRKITLAATKISKGQQEKLYLGNINAKKDWGYAKDYVECMWLSLQHKTPEDFIIATGKSHSVREFVTISFKKVGIELKWQNKGLEEKGIDIKTGKILIEIKPDFYRPLESKELIGNPEKAKNLLKWYPKTSFEELIGKMISIDIKS
ncbi:MAG: GDP-mannose 4,6-dehydratase [Flavobacteriaceae bacterium]